MRCERGLSDVPLGPRLDPVRVPSDPGRPVSAASLTVAKLYVPAGVAAFDEHRNTSRVWPVPPDAHKDVLRAVAAWRERDPAAYRWLVDGHPHLTEAEHVARFGGPYKGVRAKRPPDAL